MKKINTTYLIALSALVFASCSESDGLSSGIPLSKEKIAFAATLQDGWNGGTSAEADNSSRAGKPTFSGLAMEQKVLTANEGLAKPLYLHPLETENTSVMNAMPQTRGVMNESSTVGSFGVSAVYSKDNSFLFQNEEATQNGSYWFTSSNATWPLDGSVSFYAYAPYNETSLSLQGSDDFVKNKTIRYTANTDLSKQPDLIVAKSENNTFTSSTANKAVGLSFRHALTAITFSISADMIPGKVKSITVSGVYGQGDYDFSNASWASLANPSSTYAITLNASVKAGESKALTDKTSALMMIPQPLENAKVSMVFNDGKKDKTVSFSLDGTSWTAGKHITYVLSSSKITTLKMGSLTYPTGWNSVNTDAKNQIRKAYDPNDPNTSAGLFVVNEEKEKKVIDANVPLTYDGTSWSLPKGSKLKFSPKYCYFVYYPYQSDGLPGAPAKGTEATEENVTSAEKFFANAIATWKSSKIATDQSTKENMNACDLQIGKASLDEDGCSVSFEMEHAMGLAVLNRESKSLDHFYKLKGYEDYTWSNGSVPTTANGTISSGQKLFSTIATQGIMVVAPNSTVTFTNTSTGKDEWKYKSVPIKINEGNKVYSGEAKLKLQHYDENTYTMEVGDIYYSDGAMTHQSEALASDKTPIGIVGYLGNNYWTEKGVSGKGGHALVMCLKTIGSTGSTKAAQEDFKNGKNVQAYIGTGYAWYSSNIDAGRTKVNNKSLLVNSYKETYGSGYTETDALIKKWGPAAAAAYQAQKYSTLPANSTKCTGWFLPTAGQYYAVMTNLGATFSSDWTGIWDGNTSTHPKLGFFNNMTTVTTNINNKLKKVGDSNYTEFFGDINTWEWTSSEFSSTNAVYVDSGVDNSKGSGSVRFSYATTYLKTFQTPVRPFLAF